MTDNNNNKNKTYDFILFGVTGLTGKLAVEYMLRKSYPVRWAACGRNQAKTEAVLQEIVDRVNQEEENKGNKEDENNNNNKPHRRTLPPIVIADLICTTPEQENILSDLVQQTKVVLTMAGPFEKYGLTLVKLCAQHGVHYADITGETDFVRRNIQDHDDKARQTGACIVSHCGNDCIPQDLMVFEMNHYTKQTYGPHASLLQVQTFPEFPANATLSGGTAKTAVYQLGKKKNKKKNNTLDDQDDFDPLLRSSNGTKSQYGTKNISTKKTIHVEALDGVAGGQYVGPWIMGPVMVNCIRRSNALLHYHTNFSYGDAQVKSGGIMGWINEVSFTTRMAGAIAIPSLLGGLVPKPGEGPDRQVMEHSFMTLHALGKIHHDNDNNDNNNNGTTSTIQGTFHFNKDIGYLYTAYLLMEVGMVLLDKHNNGTTMGGILTPAVAMGQELTQRILSTLDARLSIWNPIEEKDSKKDDNDDNDA